MTFIDTKTRPVSRVVKLGPLRQVSVTIYDLEDEDSVIPRFCYSFHGTGWHFRLDTNRKLSDGELDKMAAHFDKIALDRSTSDDA